ncbi:MAG: hypothetical protein FGM50_09340 [Mycobacterium sp.]|nr:hypothetical protein [Mycobacterium sp.]
MDTATSAAEDRATAPPNDIRRAAPADSAPDWVRLVEPGAVVSRDSEPTDEGDGPLASVSSEEANAGAEAINDPTPNAKANTPTRPTNCAPELCEC